MLRYLTVLFLILFSLSGNAQQENIFEEEVIDSLYREDQFYLGFTYNILTDMPEVSQSGFSGGLHLGFIRDFPINERRNLALGVGVGWSINTYGQTLFIGQDPDSGERVFQVIDNNMVDYDTNRFTTQVVEVPLQFRWRTSTAESYKFWRIYSGLRLGYAYHFRSNFQQPDNSVRLANISEFDKFRLGATFTFGYNTFNFHFYYSLNPFFSEEAQLNNGPIELSTFQIGLMFYLL